MVTYIIPYANKDTPKSSFPICISLISSSFFIALVRISSAIFLNRFEESGQPHLVPDLCGIALDFLSFMFMLAVGLL